MALDVGERRIGVAIADELGMIASPVGTVTRREGDLDEIRTLARNRGVSQIVIGLPTGMSGREGPQAASVRAFSEALRATLGAEMRIAFWDERLTTVVAERSRRGARGRQRKERVDAVAAAVILQGYLDARRVRPRPTGQEDGGDGR